VSVEKITYVPLLKKESKLRLRNRFACSMASCVICDTNSMRNFYHYNLLAILRFLLESPELEAF